ncbi:uncharacterized protein F4812DRAFT_129285 [Daldinia caldariorum]|uniref:uncharacterized protein n=1 Tax=Daldinia caldariorum TaxID=326644 RepID=UPI002007852A|nr:uncharacterized protein F4812DRAFT_129285 [Daldinia caldariorum]KAI1465045.1 hypothetical protein F4812DRAFT_129285 [Daldinia caldariorum]
MTADDPLDNFFIRFKNHIDNNIHRGFQTILALPAQMANREQEIENRSTNDHHVISQQRKSMNHGPDSNVSSPDDTREADVRDVYRWAILSPYSPLNLQTLRQPRPADAPRDCPDCFTFRDAFEDLLAVNSGKPLHDLRAVAFTKNFEHARYFPWGMSVEDWVAGVGLRGLWNAYFPLSQSARRDLSNGIIPWRGVHIRELSFHQSPVSTWPSMISPPGEHRQSSAFRDPVRYEGNAAEREAETTYPQEADTEYDLYEATADNESVEVPVPQGFDRQTTATTTTTTPTQVTTRQTSDDGTVTEVTETPDGGKIVKTIQQHSSKFGNRVGTVTKQYNSAGELVSTSRTNNWSWSYHSDSDDDDDARERSDEKDERSTRKDQKFSSWFWK